MKKRILRILAFPILSFLFLVGWALHFFGESADKKEQTKSKFSKSSGPASENNSQDCADA
jgi:hypothetical protein